MLSFVDLIGGLRIIVLLQSAVIVTVWCHKMGPISFSNLRC